MTLQTRDDFREKVFARDKFTCVIPGCGKEAKDAHHIIERRLWEKEEQGGYYLANGASLCNWHHQYAAETSVLQPGVLRQYCGITETKLPKQFDQSRTYDKWGIAIRRPNRRLIKYPSTSFLPFSPGPVTEQFLPNLKPFLNQPLIITTKMDGSNVCLSSTTLAARNGETAKGPSFSLLKERYETIYKPLIPDNIQIFGEWLFAKHSIHYTDIPDYLQIFGVYDMNTEIFASFTETQAYAARLGVPTVPVLQTGLICEKEHELATCLQNLAFDAESNGHEGIVVRIMYPFPYGQFEPYETTNDKTTWQVVAIAKYVRPNFNQCANFNKQKIVKNVIGGT